MVPEKSFSIWSWFQEGNSGHQDSMESLKTLYSLKVPTVHEVPSSKNKSLTVHILVKLPETCWNSFDLTLTRQLFQVLDPCCEVNREQFLNAAMIYWCLSIKTSMSEFEHHFTQKPSPEKSMHNTRWRYCWEKRHPMHKAFNKSHICCKICSRLLNHSRYLRELNAWNAIF